MERREHVPDLRVTADSVLADLRDSDESQGFLDAVAALQDHTIDDLITLVVLLGRRLIDCEDAQEDHAVDQG